MSIWNLSYYVAFARAAGLLLFALAKKVNKIALGAFKVLFCILPIQVYSILVKNFIGTIWNPDFIILLACLLYKRNSGHEIISTSKAPCSELKLFFTVWVNLVVSILGISKQNLYLYLSLFLFCSFSMGNFPPLINSLFSPFTKSIAHLKNFLFYWHIFWLNFNFC